jgi:hypothetical protein
MSKQSKVSVSSLKKLEKFETYNEKTGELQKITFPNRVEIGIDNSLFLEGLQIYGSLSVSGSSLLESGAYINFGNKIGSDGYGLRDNSGTIQAKNSGGSWVTIGAGGDGNPGGANTQVQFNNNGSFGGDSSFTFNSTSDSLTVTNLSASLTRLAGGTSYLVAGDNVTIASQSNGSILISSTGGSSTSAVTGTFNVPSPAEFVTTASVSFAGEKGFSYTADSIGVDTFFFVSGTQSVQGSSGKVSVFGGDVIISGTLFGGSPLKIGGDFEFNTGSGATPALKNPSGSIKLFASEEVKIGSDEGSIRLIDLGGSTAGKIFITGSQTQADRRVKFLSKGQVHFHGRSPNDANTGTDVFLFVSGAKGRGVSRGTALFGGDVFISGTWYGTGTIGYPEDGAYSDGLFTDFTSDTTIGTAVDRFNEVLKGLAPSAAPSLDDIDCDDSGTSAKLSFGSSQSISGYTNVAPSGLSSPSSNLSNVDINGTYSSTTVSNDVRVACFNGATVVDGTLNEDVSADSPNYSANSFGDGDSGTLYLFVNNNSSAIHSVDLSSFGSGNSLNGNGSGFNLSAVTNGAFSDGSAFSTFKHRTGTYKITAADQREGWNFARVAHVVGSTTTTTNYVEWVNDSNSNALSSAGSSLDSLSMTGTKNLSGVKYNTGGSATYKIRVSNAYRNVYSTSNITFNGTNCSVSSQAFPTINYGAGESETKTIHITGSATIDTDPMLNAAITVSTNVPHPLKTNLSSAGSQSISGILLYNLSNTSTVLSETFRAENYRIKSGSYTSQSSVTDSDNTWDSTTSLSTVDGLLFYNSRLYAPAQGGVSGDFRNTSDGGSISNGPGSNVNYSSITSGKRTFYRYFQNNSGGSKTDFTITANGSGTIVSQGTSLGTGNISILIKIPNTNGGQSTGWMDVALPFETGETGDGAGCLNGSLDSSLNATNAGTFGTVFVGDDEYVVVKIEADASFTGYVSRLTLAWS